MKNRFLIKPAFYIFSLFFSSWLVMSMERMQQPGQESRASQSRKERLKKLFEEYKSGSLDSTMLVKELDRFFYEEQLSRSQ